MSSYGFEFSLKYEADSHQIVYAENPPSTGSAVPVIKSEARDAKKMAIPSMQKVFRGFAAEELGHKKKLEMAKEGKLIIGQGSKVTDLKIADYLVEVEPGRGMNYQDALVLAMKREKAAFKLYMDLSDLVSDPHMGELFLHMAQEEAKHKLRFEIEYDENVMEWN